MRSRFVVLILLVLATVAPAALAQEADVPAPSGAPPEGTFYYHWETPERLLLWQDLDQLVGVTVELQNSKWLPADRQGLLKRLDEEVKKQYPREEDHAVVLKQWEVSLEAALRRSGGDYKQWLETLRRPNGPTPGFIPRQPDVMIYLHVDTAAKKARMRLLSGLAAVGSQAYELSQKEEGQTTVWKSSGVPIEIAMGVKWEPARILEIAGLKGSDDLWTVLIDTWKEKPTGFFRQQLYKTSKEKTLQEKTAWAWFEVVDNEDLLRLSGTKGPMRIMPEPVAAQTTESATTVERKPEPWTWRTAMSRLFLSFWALVALVAVDGGEATVWLLLAARLGAIWLFASSAFVGLTASLVLKLRPDDGNEPRVLKDPAVGGVDKLEFSQIRRTKTFFGRAYRWLQGVLGLLLQAEARQSKLLTRIGNLERELEQARARISSLEVSERTLQGSEKDLKTKVGKLALLEGDLKNQERLLTEAENKVFRLEGEKTDLIEKCDLLQGKLEKAGRDRTQAETALRQEHTQAQASLREKHAQAEAIRRKEVTDWKTAEAKARNELAISKQTVQGLNEELSAARTQNGQLKEQLQNLGQAAQQLEAVGAVGAVSPFLRRGQNQFLNETDVQSAGLLAFLVTHSLNQLALSRAFSQETKASAMLWNLHNIASRLAARYPGFMQALPRLQQLGASDAPLADDLIAVNAQHEDSKLFQLTLKQLRTAHRIDLAPFYFDVAKDGRVVRAN